MTRPESDTATGTTASPEQHSTSPGFRLGLLVVLVLVLVASVVVFVALLTSRTLAGHSTLDRVSGLLSGEDPIAEEREAVLSVATQFMLRVNTYGPDDLAEDGTMPDYRQRVGELITPAFRADFEGQVGIAEQTVAQAQLGREAQVYASGVSVMDADSATALVAGDFTNSYPGSGRRAEERVETPPAPFRVRVTLVKVSGQWLVDDFAPVTGQGVTLDPSGEPDPGVPGDDDPSLAPQPSADSSGDQP